MLITSVDNEIDKIFLGDIGLDTMQDIATELRTMQLIAQNGHNLAKGQAFFADHDFLGELYEAYEGNYDSVAERAIGTGQDIDLLEVSIDAAEAAKPQTSDVKAVLKKLLDCEIELCELIEKAVPDASDGTQNLLQGIADDSESRQYKISRRLK